MFNSRQYTPLLSRMLLAAGVLCFGASMLVSYHQDQMAANSVLAQKAATPKEVRLQDYAPDMHSNILREVRVLAEVGFDRATFMNAGTAERPKWIGVVPIFAVSRLAQPFATRHFNLENGLEPRPVPRAEAPILARALETTRMIETQTLGVIMTEVASEAAVLSPETLDFTVLGRGLNGPLVRLEGAELTGSAHFESAADALLQNGTTLMPDILMVSPNSNPRAAILAIPDRAPLRHGLTWASILFVLGALALRVPFLDLLPRKEDETTTDVPSFENVPGVFQPIRTQAEIAEEQRKGAEPSTRRALSRIVGQAADTAADAVRPVKNQQ